MLATRWFVGTEQGGRSVPYGYESAGAGLWEDKAVLPLGFIYDTIISKEQWAGLSALERQELMLRAVYAQGVASAGVMPESGLVPVEITHVGGQGAWLDRGELNAYEAGSTLTIAFQGIPRSETYLRLSEVELAWADTPRFAMTVQAGQSRRECLFSGENFLWHSEQGATLINLGYSEQGLSRVTLSFDQPGGLRLDDVEVWCQPMDEYEDWRDERRTESLTDVQMSADRISGSITTAGRRVLAFAIPYSPGWEIYVDGQPVKALKANDFLLAVELEAGEHEVLLRYHSPGFRPGMLLSGFGLAGVAAMLLCRRKDRKAI